MTYNFKVGDRVRTEDGAWGTLVKSENGEWAWVCCQTTDNFSKGGIYSVTHNDGKPHNHFTSIGIYDFTKPQKIEKIKNCIMLNLKECNYTDERLVEKINEIIDHINKLEEN